MVRAGIKPLTVRSPAYLGPPQNLEHALVDLVRLGRYRRVLEHFSKPSVSDGETALYPTRLGWGLLRATEWIYDRAGVGTVAVCVGKTW